MFYLLFTGSPPLSLDAISNLCKRTRSQSLDRDRKVSSDSVKNDDSFEIDEDLADPTLKMGLPQKAYEFGLEIGRYCVPQIYPMTMHAINKKKQMQNQCIHYLRMPCGVLRVFYLQAQTALSAVTYAPDKSLLF